MGPSVSEEPPAAHVANRVPRTDANPLEPTSERQLRARRWAHRPHGDWGVKANATAHLYPEGQHFSICGTAFAGERTVVIGTPKGTRHPACSACRRIAEPRFGPRGSKEKGDRPDLGESWRSRHKTAFDEPLMSVAQFETFLDEPANVSVQITRLKIVGNTLHVFTDSGLTPMEHLKWITSRPRARPEVEWVEIVTHNA